MIRSLLVAAAAMSLLIGTGAGAAPPCKDPKTHKFIKCPPPAAKATTTAKTNRCRDAKGRFAKCGTAGTHPA
jgi:hypothetical protein